MKKIYLTIMGLILILSFSATVNAIALSPGIYKYEYDEKIGLDKEVTFFIKSRSDVDLMIDVRSALGLKDYVSFQEQNFTLKPGQIKEFKANFNLPPDIDRVGTNEAQIIFTKRILDNNGGFMSVTTALAGRIIVTFAYPGEYVVIKKLSPLNVNQGENTTIDWEVQAMGMNTTNINATLLIKDNQKIIFNKTTTKISLERNQRHFESTKIPSSNFQPGKYEVILRAKSNDNSENQSANLRIGEENIALLDFEPKEFSINEIVEFSLLLENLWGEKFSNVYAILSVENISVTTKSITLESFETKKIDKQYIDLRHLKEGNYLAELTVYFEGNSKTFTFNLNVTDDKDFKMLPIIVAVVVLIIVGILTVILFHKDNKNKANKSKKNKKK